MNGRDSHSENSGYAKEGMLHIHRHVDKWTLGTGLMAYVKIKTRVGNGQLIASMDDPAMTYTMVDHIKAKAIHPDKKASMPGKPIHKAAEMECTNGRTYM